MLEKRFAASSVVMENETIWVVGGHDGYNELSSTEFLSIDQPPVRGPGIYYMCLEVCSSIQKEIILLGRHISHRSNLANFLFPKLLKTVLSSPE